MNILYHHRTQGRGAEGVHITSIVKALQALGHDVTIISPPGIDPMQNAGNAPVDKSEVTTSGINSLWRLISKYSPNFIFEIAEIVYNLPSLKYLERELSTKSYDLIYERYAFYMVSGAIQARRYGIPLVLEANEVNGIKDRARKQSMPWLCGKFESFLFRRCTSIHTVSSYLKDRISGQGVEPTRIRVSPNAIDPDKFSQKTDTRELRDSLGLRGKFVVGFAGWFDDWDRLDLLVEVFARLASRIDKLALLLVGDGKVLDEVRRKSTELGVDGRIVLTGAVTRDVVHQYLSLLDIAVITHSNEFGSPVVMFEFMGLKIPIIAPRLLPVTDVLDDGQNAVLFDVLDMQDLETRLESLVANPDLQREIAQNAYRQLMENHTWHCNAEHIVADTTGVKPD